MTVPAHIEIRLEQIKTRINKLVSRAKSGTLSEGELVEVLEYINALKQEYRKVRGEYDVLYFAYEYFSFQFNPENENNLIPEGTYRDEAADLHVELCDLLDSFNDKPVQKIGDSMPRGHGKSAYLSNVFPVHQVVYSKRKYMLIVSETEGMAQKFIEWVGGQLKFNQKLRADFGPLLHPNKMSNERDNSEEFITTSGIKVQSAGIGKQLRGARHGAYRPDLVILDDLESQKNTNTKELREKNIHWFNSVIIPIGDPTRTAYIYMGTLIHTESLLAHILNRSDFKCKKYSAIVSEPHNPQLWEQFEDILKDQDEPDREYKAEQFYYSQKAAMDKGVKTLWPSRFSYLDLMKIKSNVGSRAFGTEYLNVATDEETAIFKSSYITYYDDKDLFDDKGRRIPLELFGFYDIAIGKSDRSDYNAIIMLGRDNRTGVLYVLDAWAEKVALHKAVEVCYKKILEYRPKIFGIETIQAQYEVYRQMNERITKAGLYGTRIKPVNPKGRKEDRIETLEPLVENGTLRFKKSQRLLIEQLTQYPQATHDDTIDALASAVDLASRKRVKTHYNKPLGL